MSENIWIRVILPSSAEYRLALPTVPRIGERFNFNIYCDARSKMIALQGIVKDVVWTEKMPLIYLKSKECKEWSPRNLKDTKGQ